VAVWCLRKKDPLIRETSEVFRQAGYRFGRTRSWCPTGRARRNRKSGVVEVIDPDAVAKKTRLFAEHRKMLSTNGQ
jgi:hypothetical protein